MVIDTYDFNVADWNYNFHNVQSWINDQNSKEAQKYLNYLKYKDTPLYQAINTIDN